MEKADFDAMNQAVIQEFRTTGGTAGGVFAGKQLVLVHHTGAKSGVERIAPLVALRDDGQVYIFASKGGADSHPDWYHNLLAHPDVTVELGTETYQASARVLDGAERDEIYAKQVAVEPQFGDYQRKTDRVIPVVELVRS